MSKFSWILTLAALFVLVGGCTAPPIHLYSYHGKVFTYPNFLPLEKPTVFAFLDGNDRRCDLEVKPLKGLSGRKEIKLVGVLCYDHNSFLEQITYKEHIVFPILLDPKKKLIKHYRVSRYPTYIFVSPYGKEVDRAYELGKVNEWYRPEWIHRAFGRKYHNGPDDLVGQ